MAAKAQHHQQASLLTGILAFTCVLTATAAAAAALDDAQRPTGAAATATAAALVDCLSLCFGGSLESGLQGVRPVGGTDNKTYLSLCELQCVAAGGVTVSHEGVSGTHAVVKRARSVTDQQLKQLLQCSRRHKESFTSKLYDCDKRLDSRYHNCLWDSTQEEILGLCVDCSSSPGVAGCAGKAVTPAAGSVTDQELNTLAQCSFRHYFQYQTDAHACLRGSLPNDCIWDKAQAAISSVYRDCFSGATSTVASSAIIMFTSLLAWLLQR